MSSLITDGDKPEQVWQGEQNALVEVKLDGWNAKVGPSTLYAEAPDQPGREVCGYVLRWSVH